MHGWKVLLMMRNATILLALACIAGAFSVEPDFIDVQETGNENLPSLDVRIGLDCTTKDVGVTVLSDEDGEPLDGAKAYLFYTDYTYQALPNPGTTDAEGSAVIPVPGSIRFLNAMFILRVDKQGFRSKEIQFVYEYCFDEPPQDEPEEEEADEGPAPEEAEEDVSGEAAPAEDESPEVAPEAGNAADGNATDETRQPPADAGIAPAADEPVAPPPQGGAACPAGFALLALLFSRMRA